MSGPGWLGASERGSLLGMRFVVWLYLTLGRRVCNALLVPLVAYFFVTGRPARQASRRYLARLHHWSNGRSPLAGEPRLRHSLRHFHAFALNIMDRVAFFAGDVRDFEVVVHGREHLEALVSARRGALLLSAHLGSFDALRLFAHEAGVPVNVVMFLRNARMINAMFRRLNPALHLRIIDLDPASPRAVFDIRGCVQRGELVGTLGDRVGLGGDTRVSWVSFLGRPAPFPHGPFLLAAALRCPVLLMIGLRVSRTTYEVFVEPLAAEVALPAADRARRLDELVSSYVRRLEAYCLRAPYQWFNFYDVWDAPAPTRP
jgi:predicted LPLAT superfamily acyltransferase